MKSNKLCRMKKKIFLPMLVSLQLLFGSCENNFDPYIYGALLQGEYPSTEQEYVSYMMICYLPYTTVWTYDMGSGGLQHGIHIQSGGTVRMFDSTSDICASATTVGADWERFTKGDYSNCFYYWRGNVDDGSNLNHFPKTAQITRMTEIIGTLEKAPLTALTEEKKNNLLGEARLCRGLMMYFLLHVYGPVPVILDPEKVIDPEALSNTVRPSLDEMAQWITDDLEFAAKNAPETAPDLGRYTRDYARFCLMKHCLNEGEHMEGYYQRAMDMYNELNTGKYDLFKTGSTPYVDLFKNANKFNKEIIMAVSCSPAADGNPKHGNANPFLMWALPSDVAKGDPFPMGGGWFQAFSMDKKYYDAFESNDGRLKTIVTSYKDKNGVIINKDNLGVRWNGYIMNKFPQETMTTFQGTDIPLARWADVLLMYAESLIELGENLQEAVDVINKVRERAFLTTSPTDSYATYRAFNIIDPITKEEFEKNYKVKIDDDLRKAVRHERRVELAAEGLRYYDLMRWGIFVEKIRAFYKTPEGIATEKGSNISENTWPYPIPQAEIDKVGGALVQNDNYK